MKFCMGSDAALLYIHSLSYYIYKVARKGTTTKVDICIKDEARFCLWFLDHHLFFIQGLGTKLNLWP